MYTLTPQWDNFLERKFRRRVRSALRDIEVDFDPDADWEEAQVDYKKMGVLGTRFGFEAEVGPEDTWWECQEQMRRK